MKLAITPTVGLALAAATAGISGVAVFVNGLVVASFPDPVALAGVRNGLVGLALLAMAGVPCLVREVAALDRRQRMSLVGLGVVGGGIPFILFFSGLGATGGPGAAILHKTMFLWVAFLAVPLLGERVGALQVGALGLLAVGLFLAGPAPSIAVGPAAALILAATWMWAAEVLIARRLLRTVSVRLAAVSRMTIGSAVILSWLAGTGRIGAVASFGIDQWLFVGVTGLLLLGYVLTWYGALRRAPATSVSAVLVGGAVVTAGLAALRTGTLPVGQVVAGLGVIALGVVAVWLAARRAPTISQEPA
jgi:drug/metabolite transporter (DMT)-like permease